MPDTAWIEAVVARWELPLIQYAQRILGRAHDARDVVQDAFLRLCREDRELFEPRLVAWLFTVCRNGAIDRLLANALDARDRVALVTYADNSRIALPPTPGSDRRAILQAIVALLRKAAAIANRPGRE